MKIKKLILLCGCFVALMGGDYEIGMEALKNNDFAKAHEYLSKSCQNDNNIDACIEMSLLYLVLDDNKSKQTALQNISILCANNHVNSCRLQAILFVKDGKEAEAFTMDQKVCMLDKKFCNFLAYYYENGLVVRQNVTQAIKYYQESCNAGNNSGCESLQKLYNKK